MHAGNVFERRPLPTRLFASTRIEHIHTQWNLVENAQNMHGIAKKLRFHPTCMCIYIYMCVRTSSSNQNHTTIPDCSTNNIDITPLECSCSSKRAKCSAICGSGGFPLHFGLVCLTLCITESQFLSCFFFIIYLSFYDRRCDAIRASYVISEVGDSAIFLSHS